MIVASCTNRIINTLRPAKSVDYLIKGGFRNISLDFNMGYMHGEDENEYEMVWDCIDNIVGQCEVRDVNIAVARTLSLPLNTKRPNLNGYIADITAKCIEYCGRIGCGYIVVPPLFAGIERKNAWRENHEFYMRLGRIALRHNVKILLKNLVAECNGHFVRGLCSEPYEASEWIDSLNSEIGSECFGFCMDVCVCNICRQDLYEFIVALGKRINAVVIRDTEINIENNMEEGHRRTHEDWRAMIRGFREIGFDGIIIIDYADSIQICPLKLMPNIYTLVSGLGDYFKWQIGIENVLRKYNKRVLFGAGKMCSNYMKYYGEQYPPLFTCDNNSALWGTVIEGLEVKSPDALKDIAKDCAIFICNVYYDEINKQLLDMGLENPIERFNDEFLYETEKEI